MKYVITVCDNFLGEIWVDYFVAKIDKHKVVLGDLIDDAEVFPSENSANKWVEFLNKEASKSKYKVIEDAECFTTLKSLWEARYFFKVKEYSEI